MIERKKKPIELLDKEFKLVFKIALILLAVWLGLGLSLFFTDCLLSIARVSIVVFPPVILTMLIVIYYRSRRKDGFV